MTTKDTARVILTEKCPRNCPYCVNKYGDILKQAKPFRFMHDMVQAAADYDTICLTGGEPMVIMPEHTVAFANVLKAVYPNKKVYCYVAGWRRWDDMAELIKNVDGIHYTMHASSMMEDLGKFYIFQDMARLYPGKSFRLYIHPQILVDLTIVHGVWSRVELKKWLEPAECKLPANEDLFIWRS